MPGEPRTEDCRHRRIDTFSNEAHGLSVWACHDCRIRFYPHNAAERSEAGQRAAAINPEWLARALAAWWVMDRPLFPVGTDTTLPEAHRDDAELIAREYNRIAKEGTPT